MPGGSAVRNRSETVSVVTPRGEVEVARQGDARPEARQLLDVVLARAKKGQQRVERGVDRTRGNQEGDPAVARQAPRLAEPRCRGGRARVDCRRTGRPDHAVTWAFRA